MTSSSQDRHHSHATGSPESGAVLVANRGEIAVRVLDTLARIGRRSVAVYSDADADALHVERADEAVRLGPAAARESYLAIDKVLDAAARTGAWAVHPGYGFLSENAAFARACEDAGIEFVGPPASAIETMGDKISAKTAVSAYGVPVVPGIARPGLSDDDLVGAAPEIGFPVLIKPSAGGGGKGMHVVHSVDELPAALAAARREAGNAFGDDTLFLERFVLRPRHIEVQVLADKHGNVVHLGERECSLQRRHQKVVEEAPSPLLDAATRDRIGKAACDTARSVGYVGAGTVEFIVSADRPDEFFFMEMNTRLQVEHPVTELVTGLDLVELQIRIAQGEPLPFTQDDVTLTGHAVEARVYAEDPARGFLPTGGTVLALREPRGDGVRIDSGLKVGTVVGTDYDPMLSKVVVHAADRASALTALDHALSATVVQGTVTNIDFLRFLLADPHVVAGDLDTELVDRLLPDYSTPAVPDDVFVAAAAQWWADAWAAATDPWSTPSGWRIGGAAPVSMRLQSGDGAAHVLLTGTPDDAVARVVRAGDDSDGGRAAPGIALRIDTSGDDLSLSVDGLRRHFRVTVDGDTVWVWSPEGTWPLRRTPEPSTREGDTASGDAEITSPMPGSVIAVAVGSGATVSAGDTVVVVEAMKMEHALTAPVDGTVEVVVGVGDQVRMDQVLARIEAPATDAGSPAPE